MNLAARLNAIYADNIAAFERDYPELASDIRQRVLSRLETEAKHSNYACINIERTAHKALAASRVTLGASQNALNYVKHVCLSLRGGGVWVSGPDAGTGDMLISWTHDPVQVPADSDTTGRGARAITTLDDIVNDILSEFDENFLAEHGDLPKNWRDDPETEARILVRALINLD